MGCWGSWSLKPEMGYGNALDAQYLGFGNAQYFMCIMCNTCCVLLRPWMPLLRKVVNYHVREQIRQRAEQQDREMVKRTVSKKSNKPSVWCSQLVIVEFLQHLARVVHVNSQKSIIRSGGKDMARSANFPRDFGRFVAESHLKCQECISAAHAWCTCNMATRVCISALKDKTPNLVNLVRGGFREAWFNLINLLTFIDAFFAMQT